MADCTRVCSEAFDQRTFQTEVDSSLKTLLASTATKDIEVVVLCDVQGDGTTVPFLRVYTVDCDGERSTADYTLDGTTPYVTTGTVHDCDGANDAEFLVLCDVQGDGTTIPFIRVFITDDDGVRTSADFQLDGSTPYVTTGTVDVCDGTNDVEYLVLCDDQGGGVITPFIRVFTVDDDGVRTSSDFQLDGATPYVVVGTATVCDGPNDSEFQVLCDDQGAGTIVTFLRVYTVDDGGNITAADYALDGTTPYTVLGTVVICDTINDTEYVVLCDVQGSGVTTPFLRVFVTDDAGTRTSSDFQLDGSTPYVVTGTVDVCDGTNDVEIVTLCDVSGAGVTTPFLRIFTTNDDGTRSSADFQLDGTTPYVVTGTVDVCDGANDAEYLVLCDINGATTTPFIRRFILDDNGVQTSADFELDGSTPYVVAGTADICFTIKS